VFSLILKKPNTVCTRYPGVHSTFTCYQPNLRLNPPNATPLSMSRALSLSFSFPVPGSFPFLAITRPVSCPVPGSFDPWSRCGLRRAARRRRPEGEEVWLTAGGAAYDGRRRRGRRAEEGGAAYGTTGASGAWDRK
jgi:hypothetical protein